MPLEGSHLLAHNAQARVFLAGAIPATVLPLTEMRSMHPMVPQPVRDEVLAKSYFAAKSSTYRIGYACGFVARLNFTIYFIGIGFDFCNWLNRISLSFIN